MMASKTVPADRGMFHGRDSGLRGSDSSGPVLQSGFSLLKDDFIKSLTSGSLNVSLLDECSRDAFDRGNKLLEEIVSARNGSDEYSSSLGNIPSKNSIDSWTDSFQHIINVDVSYVRRETDKFKICIPSVIGVPFESRELLKTLQTVMKRGEQSQGSIGAIKREVARLLEDVSSSSVDEMSFDVYESLCSAMNLYSVVDQGACSVGVKEILGREHEQDIVVRASKLREDFEAVSRDDTLKFNKLVHGLKQRRTAYDVEKSSCTTRNRNDFGSLITILKDSLSVCDDLKLPASNREEIHHIVAPFIEDMVSFSGELQKLYDERGGFKSVLKSAIKRVGQYESFISKVISKREYSVFDLSIIREFCEMKKEVKNDDASGARRIDELSGVVQEYDFAKSRFSSALARVSETFDKDFMEMIALYRERLDTSLTISSKNDIVAAQSRIRNEMRYLEPVAEADLPVSDSCKSELKLLLDMYARRRDDIDEIVDKKRDILNISARANAERIALERMSMTAEYSSIQRVRESLEDCMTRKVSLASSIEEKRSGYVARDDERRKSYDAGDLSISYVDVFPFVEREFSLAREGVASLENMLRKKMLDFRDSIQNLLMVYDKNCSSSDREVRLVLLENALLPLQKYVDCETQMGLLKKKREGSSFAQESGASNGSSQSGRPYCLESAVSKIPVPDFKMQEFQSVLIGDTMNNYVGRMKEYLSKVDKFEKSSASTLISSQREFFHEVSIVLNSFGHSTTCANLEDGSYVMDLVFKARDASQRLGRG